MSNEIYNVEDVKNEFLQNVLPEYAKNYSKQQIDLSVYFLTDFVNNLVANDLVLLKIEEQPPQPTPQPVYREQPRSQEQPRQMRVQSNNQYAANPFEEEIVDVQEYVDPRTQRMRVDDYRVAREVAEMNQQLQRNNQPIKQDINMVAEKDKTFVDKIRDMRSPKKKDSINPEE